MLLGAGYDRIQKLLLSEYCDFSDTVLVESPFAETTRDGRGLREVALGLTPSRLVIAADIMKRNSEFTCHPDLDPSIESLELVSVYPLEFVRLSIFRRRRQRTLKARLIDGRAKYYELGGMGCRSMLWSLWCTHIRDRLARSEARSSMSETTAASSSSDSTLRLLSSGVEFNEDEGARGGRSRCRVWARYGGAGDGNSTSWPRKDVYLGPSYAELAHGYYTPVPVRFAGASLEGLADELRDSTPKSLACRKTCGSWPCPRNPKSPGRSEFGRGALCDVLFTREGRGHRRRNPQDDSGDCSPVFDGDNNDGRRIAASGTSPVVSPRKSSRRSEKRPKRRSGSPRKQGSALAPKLSRFGFGVRENCGSGLYLEPWEGDREHFRRTRSSCTQTDRRKLRDLAVSLWEDAGRSRQPTRHPRRYGLATAAHFLHALGPWCLRPGERESVQRGRASSAVAIRRQPAEPELRLPVSRRQLAASVSLSSLEPGKSSGAMGASTRGGVVLFWTPEYWYRPRAATAAYRELRRHLSLLRDFRSDKERLNGRKLFCRRKTSGPRGDCDCPAERSSCILGRIFSSRDATRRSRERGEDGGTTAQLRRLLRMDLRATVWDLDSETLARQLTLIDRDLFVRIPLSEVETLVFQRSSRNAPNVGAWIAFAHRVSCITSSEILATKKLDMRARIVARFINAAEKCERIGNFNSCRSILAGLQSPPVYRLRATWSRLRTRHSTRYETMERLCRIYRSTVARSYATAWSRCEKRPPSLPYVGDLLGRILSGDGRVASETRRNRPCGSVQASRWSGCGVSSAGNNVGAMSDESLVDTKRRNENLTRENAVEPRRSLGRRILSAALTKIRSSKSRSVSIDEREDSPLNARERMLGRRVCSRWRRFVAVAKILAEEQAKLADMDPKRRKVFEICAWMTDRQRDARGYNFAGHSLAWEFLLKARYREDRENFFASLRLEPPCG